jgi:tRNA threonylcarbamoyladenosine biosynthesis protein TsaE
VPILPEGSLEIACRSVEQTRRLGERLGNLLAAGDVVCLYGELGSGKTTFAAGIGHGWGSSSRLTSPTYNLIHVHQRNSDNQKLYHVDAYRLETPDALWSVGFDDVFEGNGPVIIEWPQRLKRILPASHLQVEIYFADDGSERRLLLFQGIGQRYEALVQTFRQSMYGV